VNPDFKDRSILITGCSSGIGYYAAKTLHHRGYQVYATTRKAADTELLSSHGIRTLQLDLDDHRSIENTVAVVLKETGGKLYGLLNNGGFGQPALVFGWHELTRKIIPVMRAQGHGRIIQNSSVLGFAAMPHRGAYNAAKFAIEGLSDTLRLELRATDIHVSIIQPGPIKSRFRQHALTKFKQHIDSDNSVHAASYQKTLQRLETREETNHFTLGPEAVTDKLIHALEHQRPRSRYRVTTPTIAFAVAKRLFPTSVLDRILSKVT